MASRYTGTITPAQTHTYRLGGGNGTLTLPNNQLTGANDVQVTNGGEVVLNGANTYSGVTRIQAKYHTTTQNQAIANTATNISNVVYEGTTLTVNTLLNGGVNSSIGSSSERGQQSGDSRLDAKVCGIGRKWNDRPIVHSRHGRRHAGCLRRMPGSAMNFTNTGAWRWDWRGAQTGSIFDTGTAVRMASRRRSIPALASTSQSHR